MRDPQANKNGQSVDLFASAIGLKIQYASMFELFTFLTGLCPGKLNCDVTCSNKVCTYKMQSLV